MNLKKFFNSKSADEWRFLKFGRVASPLIALLTILAMLVASSIAWFTNNRNLGSNDMDMALKIDDTSAIYQAYKFDIEQEVGIDKITNDNGEVEQLHISNLDLNQYDTIFSVQNQYTPAFAKIQITRISSMPENGTLLITIDRDGTVPGLEADGKLTERISSILRFTAIIDSTKEDINITDADALYKHINTDERYKTISGYNTEQPHSKTFVSIHEEDEGHTHEKLDAITVAVSYTESDWYFDDDGHQTLNAYLYLSYDVQLIECYIDEHSGDGISFDDTVYEFENDLKKVAVSYTTPSN